MDCSLHMKTKQSISRGFYCKSGKLPIIIKSENLINVIPLMVDSNPPYKPNKKYKKKLLQGDSAQAHATIHKEIRGEC